jgi:hypothetical protein
MLKGVRMSPMHRGSTRAFGGQHTRPSSITAVNRDRIVLLALSQLPSANRPAEVPRSKTLEAWQSIATVSSPKLPIMPTLHEVRLIQRATTRMIAAPAAGIKPANRPCSGSHPRIPFDHPC